MALRNLAVKMRIPASPARRLLSSTPASGSRPLPFALCPPGSPDKVARDWYLLQRGRFDSVTRDLKNLSRLVLWTEKLELFFRRVYQVGAPLATGYVAYEWIKYEEADIAARK